MLKAYLYTGDDRRAMQLVCNLQERIGSDGFYLGDDQTMELIEQMMKCSMPMSRGDVVVDAFKTIQN
jgi:hypothetical protein